MNGRKRKRQPSPGKTNKRPSLCSLSSEKIKENEKLETSGNMQTENQLEPEEQMQKNDQDKKESSQKSSTDKKQVRWSKVCESDGQHPTN